MKGFMSEGIKQRAAQEGLRGSRRGGQLLYIGLAGALTNIFPL